MFAYMATDVIATQWETSLATIDESGHPTIQGNDNCAEYMRYYEIWDDECTEGLIFPYYSCPGLENEADYHCEDFNMIDFCLKYDFLWDMYYHCTDNELSKWWDIFWLMGF